jgi:predicted  nucleic acid-binding Zn-ribbon protein
MNEPKTFEQRIIRLAQLYQQLYTADEKIDEVTSNLEEIQALWDQHQADRLALVESISTEQQALHAHYRSVFEKMAKLGLSDDA